MTRGKIIYVTNDMQVYTTIEFNGDMYPFDNGHGEDIINFFRKQGFRDVCSYERYVKKLDQRYFGYSSEYGMDLVSFKGMYCDDLFDFTKNYTDYLYLINNSDIDVLIGLEEGKTKVPAGALAIIYFQNLREIIQGSVLADFGLPKEELIELMEGIEWDLFALQKEWLYSQQMQIEKWYGQEASALPSGILSLMDRIQDAWEENMNNADTDSY
ncbi:MAG: hypothetical protein LUF92_03645 [Clostridiales bacterium]|nr:hypothetical protein [Clostridiales bacterium]